jgi:glucose/arabinose dehydrogenase
MHCPDYPTGSDAATVRPPRRGPVWSSWRAISRVLGSLALVVPSLAFGAAVPDGVWVRPGYELIVAVDGIKGPRFLAFEPGGALFVSVPGQGKIFRCTDADGDGVFEKATTFVQGKDPKTVLQGMQFHDGWLWFAQLNSISRARDTNGDGRADEEIQVLNAQELPTGKDGGHMWRALLIHQGRIYTHVGDQTNATDEPIDASERKKLWSFALDGTDKKVFATGIRNTEKFVVRPGTDEIWGVDHDIDNMGAKYEGDRKNGQPFTDHNPPAELNHYREGGFYGHPWIVGKAQPNLLFLDNPDLLKLAARTTIPEWLMPAHCAANGMIFYHGTKIPNARGDAFVASRGSWNATRMVGYTLSRILFEDGHPYGELKVVDFLEGGTKIKGRPVDCAEAPDGSILLSDDGANLVYRLRYVGK